LGISQEVRVAHAHLRHRAQQAVREDYIHAQVNEHSWFQIFIDTHTGACIGARA